MPTLVSRFLALSSRVLIKRVMDAPTLDVAAVRRAMQSRRTLPSFLPRGTRIERTEVAGRPAEWHLPADAVPGRTLLHLHGGAFIAGTPRAFRPFAAWLAREARARVLVLDYRLAPEHPYPAALDDAVGAVRALVAGGVAPRALGLVGDSAGGALALATLLRLRAAGEPLPGAAALISPITDLLGTGESVRRNAERDDMLSPRHRETLARLYAPGRPLDDPFVSPHYGDLRGLPPLLVHASDSEILLDDARRLAERGRAAGVEVELGIWAGLMHDWHQSVPIARESREAVAHVGAFLAGRLGQ